MVWNCTPDSMRSMEVGLCALFFSLRTACGASGGSVGVGDFEEEYSASDVSGGDGEC